MAGKAATNYSVFMGTSYFDRVCALALLDDL